MTTDSQAAILHTKKLGVLIRDARIASGKSLAECAGAVGVEPDRFQAYEIGELSPSLPEIELLAYHLEIPLEHFWGRLTLSNNDKARRKFDPAQLVALRQRMIGVTIRQARLEAGISLEALANKVGVTSAELENYEFGEDSMTIPLLEKIASALNRSVRDFYDRYGPVGVWSSQQHAVKGFLDIPVDLQAFITKPINRPYLELAQRLSEMSVEKLRGVAEGLLEITL